MTKLCLGAGTAGLAIATGLTFFHRPVEAIPNPAEACAFNGVSTTAGAGSQPIPNLSLTVTNNAGGNRRAIVQVSADAFVEPNAEIRISYSLDGGPPQEGFYGPSNFANTQEFFEARMVIAVIPIPPGTHTVRPFWRVSGEPALIGEMTNRCATIEVATN